MSEDQTVWRTVFNAFDRDGNGRVDREELRRALKGLGGLWTDEKLDSAFDSYDADASGELSFDQFFLLATGEPGPVDPELVRAFRAMDLDGDGVITARELKSLFDAAGVNAQAEVQAFVDEADLDGDGRITFAEFLAMAQRPKA